MVSLVHKICVASCSTGLWSREPFNLLVMPPVTVKPLEKPLPPAVHGSRQAHHPKGKKG